MSLRILVVCTANVCRSPMAEALLQHHFRLRGVDATVRSAGVAATSLGVDPSAVKVLAEMGHDISRHRPRRLDRSILDDEGSDLALVMTREHLRIVATTADQAFRRTFTMREFERHVMTCAPERGEGMASWLGEVGTTRHARDLMGDAPHDDIADPYGQPLPLLRACAEEFDRVADTVARALAILTGQW